MRKPKMRKVRITITKGWAAGHSGWAVWYPEQKVYEVYVDGSYMLYTPDYIQEYIV